MAGLQPDDLYQIQAPHFTAGLVLRMGLVYAAAPVLHYMLGWPLAQVVEYVKKKDWRLTDVQRFDRSG